MKKSLNDKFDTATKKYIEAFADCMSEGLTADEALLAGLIYFLRLEITSSQDLQGSVKNIQEIINHSISEAKCEGEE